MARLAKTPETDRIIPARTSDLQLAGGRAVIEYEGMADPIPKQSGHDARHQLRQPDSAAVPADAAGAQMIRDEIRSECFADGAEYSLVEPVEDEQRGNHKDVLRHREAEILIRKMAKQASRTFFLPQLSENDPAG
jgi:hypothetical protein